MHVARLAPKNQQYGCGPVFLALSDDGDVELYLGRAVAVAPESLLAPGVVASAIVVTPEAGRLRLEDPECWADFLVEEVAMLIVTSGALRLPGAHDILDAIEPGLDIRPLFDRVEKHWDPRRLVEELKRIDAVHAASVAVSLYLLGRLEAREAADLLGAGHLPLLLFWQRILKPEKALNL